MVVGRSGGNSHISIDGVGTGTRPHRRSRTCRRAVARGQRIHGRHLHGGRPTARPAKPVDAWFWTFHREEQTAGPNRYDILVTRERMDCAAGTAQILGVEAYRNGSLVAADSAGRPARPQEPGTNGHAKLSSVCDPGFRTDAPTYADHRVARAAVPVGAVASAPKPALPKAVPPPAAAKAPAPSGPTPVTAAEKAAAAKAPATGEAERARGELRVIGFTPELVTMVAGPRPTKDTRTAEIWLWTFLPAERSGGGAPYDASASRLRIDCAAGTTNAWGQLENYRNGQLVQSLTSSGWPPRKEPPDSLGHLAIRASCEPDFASKLTALPDHRAAREASWKHFAQHGKATPAAKASAPSGPTPVTASEKAAAAKSGTPAAKSSPPAPGAQPKGGYAAVLPGPLRVYVAAPATVQAIVGAKPEQRPSKPFETWIWIFDPGIKGTGNERFDSVAVRYRVDCAGGTLQPLLSETYLGEVARNPVKSSAAPSTPKPKTAGHDLLRAACDPQAKSLVYPNLRAARAAATKYFASQKK